MKQSSPTLALSATGLTFVYPQGTRPALNHFSLEVEMGCFLGLLGTNGSGKTTFVNLVCGLLRPDAGEITVFGKRASTRDARRSIGLCPQEIALYPSLSAEENLLFFGRLAGLRGSHLKHRVESCLELAQLISERKQRVSSYSGGMKRRLNLATALIHEPGLLLLDEPTVGVDPQSRLAIQASLESISKAGTTILYTSHYLDEVERLCDRVVVIDRGIYLLEGPTEEVVVRGKQASSFHLRLAAGRDPALIAEEIIRTGLQARVLEDAALELLGEDLASLTAEVARLAQRGDILTCETHKPTLEESFLGLTGAEVRDK